MILLQAANDYWINRLSPDLFRIPLPKFGPFQDGLPIRYYSLAYLLGLLLAWWLLKRLARRGRIGLDESQVADLIIPFALAGVMIGGRLGYVVFYDVIEDPVTHARRWAWLDEPSRIYQIWEGGMASHGGVLGVLVAMAWFARSRRVPWLHVLDLCCLTAPMGLFLGRVANFINGELWGRPGLVPWAVIFPAAPLPAATFLSSHPEYASFVPLGSVPRHPSQLYEALGEGLLLFLLLFALHRKLLPRSGALTAIFLLGYGLARIVCEQFREPDKQIGYDWLGLTRGQVLTCGMVVAGGLLLLQVLRGKTRPWVPVAPAGTNPTATIPRRSSGKEPS